MLRPHCKGTARIRQKATGAIYEIACGELDWQSSADERQMGPEICHEAMIDHPQLGMLSWSLWEYPEGVENYRQSDPGQHEIIEDFKYGLEHFQEPDNWTDFDPPDDPFSIFMGSFRQTKATLAAHGGDSGRDLLNRMLFAHHITALEAYLGDTLIKSVLSDQAAMIRLMTGDKELMKGKFSLAEIAQNPDLGPKDHSGISGVSPLPQSRQGRFSL